MIFQDGLEDHKDIEYCVCPFLHVRLDKWRSKGHLNSFGIDRRYDKRGFGHWKIRQELQSHPYLDFIVYCGNDSEYV